MPLRMFGTLIPRETMLITSVSASTAQIELQEGRRQRGRRRYQPLPLDQARGPGKQRLVAFGGEDEDDPARIEGRLIFLALGVIDGIIPSPIGKR